LERGDATGLFGKIHHSWRNREIVWQKSCFLYISNGDCEIGSTLLFSVLPFTVFAVDFGGYFYCNLASPDLFQS
jgi:protein associated with RNAse G/E